MARLLTVGRTVAAAAFSLGFIGVFACGGPAPGGGDRGESATPGRGGDLVASIRSEPATYNRYAPAGSSAATDTLTLLTHARLVRINRATDEPEAWLAERWSTSPDGLVYTIALRKGVTFSDGAPFSSADVLFSFRVAYDPKVRSSLAGPLSVNGKPLDVSAPDAATVVVKLPEPFAPGIRLLDSLPILPKHKLEAALDAGTFADAWTPSKPLSDIAGLGPFVLSEHVSGQRLVLVRNPHYFRRDAAGVELPYLDRLTLAVVPDQNNEALRLEAGESDLMANGDIRPQDHAAFRRLADQGRLKMIDVSVNVDPDFLSFNLRPPRAVDRRPWLRRKEFRQAISCGVDRFAIANTVYLGAAVPIFGPITPGNKRWHVPDLPQCVTDRVRARQLFANAGLTDRNGDGLLEDASGTAARFSIITQAGHIRERVATVVQEQLRQIGITADVVTLDPGGLRQRWAAGDYDAIYFGLQASSTDPALNTDFWLSSGAFHFWNPGQAKPATQWEAEIDRLMREQAVVLDQAKRYETFRGAQRILAEEQPSIYFVASRITLATTTKVVNPTPGPQIPQLLWSADTLASARR